FEPRGERLASFDSRSARSVHLDRDLCGIDRREELGAEEAAGEERCDERDSDEREDELIAIERPFERTLVPLSQAIESLAEALEYLTEPAPPYALLFAVEKTHRVAWNDGHRHEIRGADREGDGEREGREQELADAREKHDGKEDDDRRHR